MEKSYTMMDRRPAAELPLCRLNEHVSIAAFVIFGDVPLTVASSTALLEKAPAFDVLITAEAKGYPVGLRNGTAERKAVFHRTQVPQALYEPSDFGGRAVDHHR